MSSVRGEETLQLLLDANEEVYARNIRVREIPTIHFELEDEREISALAVPGAVTVYISKQGDELLRRIREAFESGNLKDDGLEKELRPVRHTKPRAHTIASVENEYLALATDDDVVPVTSFDRSQVAVRDDALVFGDLL